MNRTGFRVAAAHPACDGHFPGDPIVPGAVVLDLVIAVIARDSDPDQGCEIRSAKFVHPVRPGDEVSVEYERRPTGEIRFRASVGNAPVVTGSMWLQAERVA